MIDRRIDSADPRPEGLASVPSMATAHAPAYYDGTGRTNLAVYLPALGVFAYRPARGGPDVVQPFGIPGTGRTIPFTTILETTHRSPNLIVAAAAAEIPIDPADSNLGGTVPELIRKRSGRGA